MNDKLIKITYSDKLPHETNTTIINGLNQNAFIKKGLGKNNGSFSYVAQNSKGDLCAAISGFNYYGCFYIDLLFVEEKFRNKGYGKQLMLKAESLAKERKCLFIAVNTMDFEAKPFYEKLGFRVEFERTGFESDVKMYFLKKELL